MQDLIDRCNIPSKHELISTQSSNTTIEWDPLENFCQGDNQIVESYNEQRQAIQLCKNAIDDYLNVNKQTVLTKSIAIRGHPGAGKTFCMIYSIVYAITRGLIVIPTAKMSHRSLQLGGINWDKLLCLRGNEERIGIYRRAELAIQEYVKIEREKIFFSVSISYLPMN